MTPSRSIRAAFQRHFAYELRRVVGEDACLAGQAVTHNPVSKLKEISRLHFTYKMPQLGLLSRLTCKDDY